MRGAAEARGQSWDEEADRTMRDSIEQQIRREETALYLTARLYDDGVIDPRDTRTVLGIALAALQWAPFEGARAYGVFR